MKYTDEQRLAKIQKITGKLLSYLVSENITCETILNNEPIRWAITTPLYNIGEHVYSLSNTFKDAIQPSAGQRFPVGDIGWCMTMKTQTGH